MFKNNKKKKLIKKYKTRKKALEKFFEMVEENKKITFHKEYENYENCKYYISVITNEEKIQKSLFLVDDLGRNIPINLESPEYVFLEISQFKIEETIYDWSKNEKITYEKLHKCYLDNGELKNIFTLNNKLCVQVDEKINVFSLKNEMDSKRLLETLEFDFFNKNRSDAIFSKDLSIAHRKWIYTLLKNKGFDLKRLYRLKTTFSKR